MILTLDIAEPSSYISNGYNVGIGDGLYWPPIFLHSIGNGNLILLQGASGEYYFTKEKKSTWQILKGEGRGELDFVLTNDVAVKNLQ